MGPGDQASQQAETMVPLLPMWGEDETDWGIPVRIDGVQRVDILIHISIISISLSTSNSMITMLKRGKRHFKEEYAFS